MAGPSALALHAPWTDKKGRLHPLRAVVFTLLLVPGALLAFNWATVGLGARPVNVAIHSTGYWAVWILLASLLVSPLKALAGMPNVVVVRRMVGIGALAYALAHLLLYVIDQNWRFWTVATEIVSRIYLTIGFVALAGLCVLGATSTDAAVRRLGKRWKGVHRWVYAIALLTAVHFFLQSKADVSQATVAFGVFAWLMLWRQLPAGRDRETLPLVGLAVAAAALTLVAEYVWYRFGTKIDPLRVIKAELDVSWGCRPAMLVLHLGLLVAALVELRRLAGTRFGAGIAFTVAVFAAGAFLDDGLTFLFGLLPLEDGPSGEMVNGVAIVVFGLLGMVRYRLQGWRQWGVDAAWMTAAVLPLVPGVDSTVLIAAALVLGVGSLAVLAFQEWPRAEASPPSEGSTETA